MDRIVTDTGFYYGIDKIDHQQILNMYADSYIRLLFLCGSLLFLYMLYNNYVKKQANTITIKGNTIDVDELAILPATFIFVLTGTYYLGWKGI